MVAIWHSVIVLVEQLIVLQFHYLFLHGLDILEKIVLILFDLYLTEIQISLRQIEGLRSG